MEAPELKVNEIAVMAQEQVNGILDSRPEIVEEVCLQLANGGSLITAADKLGIPYSRLSVWLNADEDRRIRIKLAVDSRDEWLVHRITDELQAIGLVDIREAFDENGRLRPLSEIPDEITKCISGIDVVETSDKDGTVAQVKRIRMIDKMKALEMLGRNLEKFIERKKVEVSVVRVEEFDIAERISMISVIDVKAEKEVVGAGNRIEADVAPVKQDSGVVDL